MLLPSLNKDFTYLLTYLLIHSLTLPAIIALLYRFMSVTGAWNVGQGQQIVVASSKSMPRTISLQGLTLTAIIAAEKHTLLCRFMSKSMECEK